MPAEAARPLGALVSQGIVAGSSLLLQIIALRELGASGLGTFSLLLGVLITVNAVQTGWIGDSLTVLDRFDPGIRRAVVQSQLGVVVIVGLFTTGIGSVVDGVDTTTAILFGLASIMWVVEETLRRLLIARREFWKLVVNDASFALGSFGLVGFVMVTGREFALQTLVLALLAGAVVAIAVGVIQLPRIELSRGLVGPSRLRELAAFAVWRAAQIGLRPGSLAVVRAVVATTASLEALGQLETARLILAPVLTFVNGIGVYLLPTFSRQHRSGRPFRPAVPLAMLGVAGVAGLYGLAALAVRQPLADLLADGSVVSAGALLSWTAFSAAFGMGVPAGNAMVAQARSRGAFTIRTVDAILGTVIATSFAALGWVDAVPAGLAAGAMLGALLMLRSLHRTRSPELPTPDVATRADSPPPAALYEAQVVVAAPSPLPTALVWQPVPQTVIEPRSVAPAPGPAERRPGRASLAERPGPARRSPARLVWLLPLILIVATEYKIRRRSIDDALAGSIDPMIAAELGVYGLVGVWLVWWLAPAQPRLTPLTVLMWGYILTTAASSLYAEFPLLALARAVQLVIIGAAVHALAVDGRLLDIRRLLHGWIVLLSASIAVGLAYVAPTSNAQRGRFTWLFVHSVSAGSMLALAVPILFGLWLAAGRRGASLPWARSVYGALLIVHALFLLLTRTRGSIAAAAVAVAVMAWVWSGQRMKPQLVLGSLVGLGALALALGGPILDYLTRGESAESLATFNRRTEIWRLAWESFTAQPLHGLGFTSADGVFFDETGLGGAHNAFINVMIDVGLVGLAWWLLLIGAALAVLVRLRRRGIVGGAAGGADLVILVGLFTTSLLNSITTEGLGAGVNVSAIWLFLMAAWLTLLDRAAPPPLRHPSVADGADTETGQLVRANRSAK